MVSADQFLEAAIEEARQGLQEGGIPIGSVVVHRDMIIGRGHNRRVQRGSAILHGEMDALENAGRQPASVYRECVLFTTLSPCLMCSGAILLYAIPRVIVGENKTFMGRRYFSAPAVSRSRSCRTRNASGSWRSLSGAIPDFGTKTSECNVNRHVSGIVSGRPLVEFASDTLRSTQQKSCLSHLKW